MAQILKPYPMFFQARLLFILYGPTDLENGKFDRFSIDILLSEVTNHKKMYLTSSVKVGFVTI